jgi:hypothetical protein
MFSLELRNGAVPDSGSIFASAIARPQARRGDASKPANEFLSTRAADKSAIHDLARIRLSAWWSEEWDYNRKRHLE